jgi:ribose transport system ATP-binding protein
MKEAADAVRMQGIRKSFGGVRALDGVDFAVRPGEVHALLGENGAGKSTILKILCGVQPPDEGAVFIHGTPMRDFTPDGARRLGIAMIFQEMSLVPTLTVAQNIFLTREPRTGGIFLDDRAAGRAATSLLERLGVAIDPRVPVARLSTGQRQMTEIAKALSQDARVLIMDEPTSALSTAEVDRLFAFLRGMHRQGVSVIYVSHKMDEIQQICSHVTILRDGHHVVTRPLADLTLDTMIEHIVGRRVRGFTYRVPQRETGPPLLDVVDLTGRGRPDGVSFRLHAGEVLGIAGLLGAGRSELARAICGIDPVLAGEVRLRGARVRPGAPRAAIDAGIVLIPEDRRTQGLILDHSVLANISLPTIDRLSAAGFVDDRRARAIAGQIATRLRVKSASLNVKMRTLSGGNQQKVVLAKWLAAEPEVLVLDEPTAGVDIGSKAEIIDLIRGLADAGKGIIMISSELAELLAASDRILIMRNGRIAREIVRAEIDGWAPAGAAEAERLTRQEHGLQMAIQEAASHV